MGVFGSELHLITFLISLIELTFFFYQVIYYLSRPQDKARLYYLILLYLLIQYNIISGLLPDENLGINLVVQNILAFSVALIMAMYFPFYFYKAYDLKGLKFYAYGGSVFFLLIPFVLFFLIPYMLTGDLETSRRMVVVVPFFYALSFLYTLRKAILLKNRHYEDIVKKEVTGMYIGVLFWSSLPIVAFFESDLNRLLMPVMNFHNGSQVVEVMTTNMGLLVMTILFVRRSVKQSRLEYFQLQQLNDDLAAKVAERTKELELLHEQRTNVLVNLTHEIRTPLMLVNSYLDEYIQQHGQTKELTIVKANLDKLSNDIVNLFDIERFNKGFDLYDHNQVVDFSQLLGESIELFKSFARKKNIELEAHIELDIQVKADPKGLFRIVNNLIDNSIKYTDPNGKINIVLNQANNIVSFSVKDTGIGIPAESQNKIFIPYYQINHEKKNFQGMGLGLSIVKKIVASLQGSLNVISNPEKNQGTEVIVQLEACSIAENDHVIDNVCFKQADNELDDLDNYTYKAERLSILIVEDNIELLTLVGRKLNEKYNVYMASGAIKALDALRSTHVDLIVSDIMMDEGDGMFLIKEVISDVRLRHLPMIIITARHSDEDKLKALSMGVVAYLQKPFLIRELILLIDSLTKNAESQRQAFIRTVGKMMVDLEPDHREASQTAYQNACLRYRLTDREKDIVSCLNEGLSNKQIADRLFISDKTVAKHIQNIFEKVQVNNRVELLNKLGLSINYSDA